MLPLRLDVTDHAAAVRAVAQAVERFGCIDVAVNSAGYSDLSSFEDTTIDSFRTQVDTNFFGVVNVSKAVVPILRGQGATAKQHQADTDCDAARQRAGRLAGLHTAAAARITELGQQDDHQRREQTVTAAAVAEQARFAADQATGEAAQRTHGPSHHGFF
ncbi:SDR family oxidoreductase [Nonomuraea deserti]|uniref:SDR family oxidoreductase n=1 Tax=Nonomuraea deserti TaxID=1848322 RepID=UPI001C706C67|nr:SDR family oxidoreductase [Nonomuraea deserti]